MTFNIVIVGSDLAKKIADLINYATFSSDLFGKTLELEKEDGKIIMIRIGEGVYSYLIGNMEADVLIAENLELFNKYKYFLKKEGKCLILEEMHILMRESCYFIPIEQIKKDRLLRKISSDNTLVKIIYVSAFLKSLNLFLRDKESLIYGLKSVLAKRISEKKLYRMLNAIQRYLMKGGEQ